MKKLGKFKIETTSEELKIDMNSLVAGINDFKDYIINLDENREIIYVINKVCDHAGGRLIVKDCLAVCPMHNWKLDLASLKYNDSHIQKSKMEYSISENGYLVIGGQNRNLNNPFCSDKKGKTTIRWINHATVLIECNGVKLMTDPWLFGPAFLTGWWLASTSPVDSIDLLKEVDYVYISHNHPDHLHAETLSLIDKKKPVITPNFISASSKIFLQKLGFENIITCDFLEILELGENFHFSILKSGDFRDDSGIYLCANGHEFLFTVDSNFLNSHVLPEKIDLLMTSFAGGATGFPLCYDDYSEDEKLKIIKRNRNSIKANVIKYIKQVQPKYYMPYAGMFSENAERDTYIKSRNYKNPIEEYEQIAAQFQVNAIRPESDKIIIFEDGNMHIDRMKDVEYLDKETASFYITNFQKDYPYDSQSVINYFKNSQYSGKQILQIIPTDDTFSMNMGEVIYADFNKGIFKTIEQTEVIEKKENYRVMTLKIRTEILMCVITNYLPWEDMSIGFQMRASRVPNEYESDFWYHFTNIYIAKENFRYTSYCGACTIVDQNPIWIKTDIQKHVLNPSL